MSTIAIVGFGLHGRRIAETAISQGHRLVGVVDPALAGAAASELLGGLGTRSAPVVATVDELIATTAVDVAMITAPVDLVSLAGLAGPFLDQGIDVLTIHPDAFDPPADWAAMLDERAKTGGASFASTGVQDVWWVNVPAAAAASTISLERVEFEHATDLDSHGLGLGSLFGVGEPAAAFARVRDEVLLAEASVLGGPMRVLAKRLGLRPHEPARDIQPLTADAAMRWSSANQQVPTGHLIGFVETVRVDTDEGVEFLGTLRTSLLEPGQLPTDRVVLHGDPVLHLEHRPFPGARITDVVPVARIDDIRLAPPGLYTAATLPAPVYRHRTTP